jgi:hypothetical protein
MMKPDKNSQFVKRWQVIQRKTKELDWEKTQFAKDLRAQFDTDKQVIKWCEGELGMAAHVAQELILRSNAANVVKDAAQWQSVGGFSSVRQLVGLEKKQQVHVVQSAVLQNKSIRSVMRDQGLVAEPVNQKTDAEILAEFVAGMNIKLPPNIQKILNKYVVAKSRHLKAVA